MKERKDYKEYLKSQDWKDKRKAKLIEADHKCFICNSSVRLEVHHLVYKNFFDVLPNDLVVLCYRCHKLTHKLHSTGIIRFFSEDSYHRLQQIVKGVKEALENKTKKKGVAAKTVLGQKSRIFKKKK